MLYWFLDRNSFHSEDIPIEKGVIIIKTLHMIAFPLVLVGALNWALIALFDFNLVTTVVGSWPSVEKLVYVLVGASAVWLLVTHKNDCKICSQMGK